MPSIFYIISIIPVFQIARLMASCNRTAILSVLVLLALETITSKSRYSYSPDINVANHVWQLIFRWCCCCCFRMFFVTSTLSRFKVHVIRRGDIFASFRFVCFDNKTNNMGRNMGFYWWTCRGAFISQKVCFTPRPRKHPAKHKSFGEKQRGLWLHIWFNLFKINTCDSSVDDS